MFTKHSQSFLTSRRLVHPVLPNNILFFPDPAKYYKRNNGPIPELFSGCVSNTKMSRKFHIQILASSEARGMRHVN